MKFIIPPSLLTRHGNFGGAAHSTTILNVVFTIVVYEQRIFEFDGQTFTDLSSTFYYGIGATLRYLVQLEYMCFFVVYLYLNCRKCAQVCTSKHK